LDVQELQHGRLARRILPGKSENDRRAGANQELPGLRRVPADPDRRHYRLARVRGRYEKNLRDVSETPRRADPGPESRGLARGSPQGDDVRLGPPAGTAQASWIAGVLQIHDA